MNWKGIYMVTFDGKTRDIAAKYPFSVYAVSHTSPFFENWYIRDLIQKGAHNDAEWFGVLSPYFFTKAMSGRLTPAKIQHDLERAYKRQVGRNAFDLQELHALGFHPRLRQKNIITQGNRWHGETFSEITQLILNKAGIAWNVDRMLPKVVMHNYILARPHIYQEYVSEILSPCMDVMMYDPEVYALVWKDSMYHKKKKMTDKLKQDLGVPYYPMHTFICERLWSVYLALNGSVNFRHYGQ